MPKPTKSRSRSEAKAVQAKARASYAREQCMAAADSMMTGTGSLRERLENAWRSRLHRLEAADFPTTGRKAFARVSERIANDGREVGEMLLASSDVEVETIATDVCAAIASVLC